jgi:hypothetical protein
MDDLGWAVMGSESAGRILLRDLVWWPDQERVSEKEGELVSEKVEVSA